MEDHIEKPTLTLRQHVRDSLDGLHSQDAVPHETEPAGPLRDQHVTPGEERHGPRGDQTVGYRYDPIVVVGGPEDRSLAQNGRYDGKKEP
jgi:hypothetical protein